ncbi:MAG: CDP-diacylglycerol--glycerol-3-phosphate 3-phosphatidyltransferase [Planctomycetaceae bacterium]|jgi:CDP-diacylglycerol---glycerol-3-phosphate 3-phosphatidyltransferase|nr:CDP-diacylglycerol--glycerol-3-phosphate 3-phosphatidyltransferase [Planctomycetaceae bacterium]MBT6156939.1 CDP-diacylglycerol--glycerol-3-phosphate 3-phosphatidyltransferase [Planctomycetaceae bacterium]
MPVTEQQTDSQSTPAGSEAGSAPPQLRDAINAPNLITFSRLILALVLFVLIYLDGFWLTAAILFVVAASTDFLDGYVARRYGLVTVIGRIMDPFADKIIVCGAFIFLLDKKVNVEQGVLGSGVNAWMVLIIIGREMFISSLRGFLEKQGMDFSADWTGKIKMGLQCIAVTASLLSLAPEFHAVENFILFRNVILWATVGFTAYSGVAYVVRALSMLSSRG